MPGIELIEVTKTYDDGHKAVSELTLDIADGEFMILVGPSGCGKSTALRLIAGLEEVTAGEIRLGGERLNERAPRERDVAMVFQSYALYPHMTVRENMAFALRLGGLGCDEREAKVAEAASALELTEHLDRKPAQLSGGQRQRVAMGRAIVRKPKAFLLDEPLSNLDAKLRVEMRTQIALLHRRLGTTTVHVTHDQTEAMTLGDRLAVMRSGHLQQVGTPVEVYDAPANAFVAGFIGSPTINYLPARVDGGQLRLPFADVRLTEEILDADLPRDLLAGIRPDAFEDAALASPATSAFEARVDVLEALGSEYYAHVSMPDLDLDLEETRDEVLNARTGREVLIRGAGIVVRLDRSSDVREGETVRLGMDAARIHLFDPDSGSRLATLGSSGTVDETADASRPLARA